MTTRKDMGRQIAGARKELEKTQKQLAEQTGINKTTLSAIENGRFTGSFGIFEHYVDALGLQFQLAPKQHHLPQWDEIEALFKEDD